jgi:hypothetical protein
LWGACLWGALVWPRMLCGLTVLVLIEAAADADAEFEDLAFPLLRVVPYPTPPIASTAMSNDVSHEYFRWTIHEIEEYGVLIQVRTPKGCHAANGFVFGADTRCDLAVARNAAVFAAVASVWG